MIRYPIASVLMAMVSMAALAGPSAYAAPCPLTTASASVTLSPGTYDCPNGISIGADNVTLDCQGATLVGAFSGGSRTFGVTILSHTNVTIKNCTIKGYFYGIRAEGGSGLQILNNVLSDNWKSPTQPFLCIQAPADFSQQATECTSTNNIGDPLINLGGGLYLRNLTSATVRGNDLHNQNNGMDLYSVTWSTIDSNNASDNQGWGIHLNASTDNQITNNHADRCNRGTSTPNLCGLQAGGGGDSAGVLLVQGSHRNTVTGNSFRQSGDGLFIGNQNASPSNNNLVQNNDGSCSPHNAFEATFSTGNRFINNQANDSDYGFWLGYSHDGTVVDGNRITGNCSAGIEIEHGQRNTITNNYIESTVSDGCTREGIVLRTDGQAHFAGLGLPSDQAKSTTYTITGNVVRTKGWGLRFQQIAGGRVVTCPAMGTCTSQILNNEVTNTGSNPPVATSTCDANLNVVNSSVNLQVNTVVSQGAGNTWSDTSKTGANVLGLPKRGGNSWSNYTGVDNGGDGLGDTNLPYLDVNSTGVAQLASPGDPNPLVGRAFQYPLSGQALDFEGDYSLRATTIPGATGYLIGLFQNGTLQYENYRDEGVLSQQVVIPRGSAFRTRLLPYVPTTATVRGLVNGQWTDMRQITISLVPKRATVKVLELKYFPPDASGSNLDAQETGLTYTLSGIRARVSQLSSQLERRLEDATLSVPFPPQAPYIDYTTTASIEKLQKVPRSTQFPPFPDHFAILNPLNICNYVDGQGVRDVWIWMYQTSQVVPITSNMAMGTVSQPFFNQGSYGDVSNSYEQNDLPVCQHTYTVYDFNYGLDVGFAMLDYSFQRDRLMRFVDQTTFNKFVSPYGTGASGTRTCGGAIDPPNAPLCGSSPQACPCNGAAPFTCDYIYNERQQSVPSRCSDWHPDGTGTVETVDCTKWKCMQEDFHVWWGQRFPGRGTVLVMNAKRMRNWLEFLADFDVAIGLGKRLTE